MLLSEELLGVPEVVQLQGETLAQLSVKTDRIISMLGASMERSDQIMGILELHARTLDEHGAALARIEERMA